MRTSAPILFAFAVAAVICGCGGGTPAIVTDPQFARDALDAVYAGSLTPVRSSLDPRFQEGMPDRVTASTGTLLTDQFGAVTGLQFQSTGKADPLVLEAIWTVKGAGRDFEMKLWFHKAKLSGIWFRPSPAQDWGPVPQIGVEYARQNKLPLGW